MTCDVCLLVFFLIYSQIPDIRLLIYSKNDSYIYIFTELGSFRSHIKYSGVSMHARPSII